jgi:hypothetical protein
MRIQGQKRFCFEIRVHPLNPPRRVIPGSEWLAWLDILDNVQ